MFQMIHIRSQNQQIYVFFEVVASWVRTSPGNLRSKLGVTLSFPVLSWVIFSVIATAIIHVSVIATAVSI